MIWLYDNVDMRIGGRIIVRAHDEDAQNVTLRRLLKGFDEFMNVVIDEAEEIYIGKNANGKPNRPVGMSTCPSLRI